MLFSTAVQPSILSLFSSTGAGPLFLFDVASDTALQSDSFVHLLHDRLSLPAPPQPKSLLELPRITDRNDWADEDEGDDDRPKLTSRGRELDQTVLHIQSPTLRTTYIHCPPTPKNGPSDLSADVDVLGIKHPWIHLQVRDLGRDWAFEVGLVDHSGRAGVKRPQLITERRTPGSAPLLLLPLSFPARSPHTLTAWDTVAVNLPSLLPYFASPLLSRAQSQNGDRERPGEMSDDNFRPHPNPIVNVGASVADIPSGPYAHASFVRVYATCRLRRIWFTESGPSQKIPWEFELYAD
ncbi:hypothetical protein D9619_007987 [Psilocybe cf. subviscida]|uniref:CFA20 domain-containing protein n=1 Tax=Psilocybe cf. subviscida TaxID=2480587 RepID=A0A8H5ET60_9AGAR|nr:hypothetical protein D9619_007987 [Psilocybe cf. subviscida]